MAKASQIRSVETLACDAGWRNYHFVKIMTEDGIVGWSEYDEGFGAPGVTAAIERLAARVVGKNAFQHERIYAELFSATRPAAGGGVALAIGATCSAARSATVFAFTGRIARPGASTIPTGSSRRSPISTASKGSAARCAKKVLRR
jgi:L-alanine-DL-glutamate epimerase-like enolase superfamily enzyme